MRFELFAAAACTMSFLVVCGCVRDTIPDPRDAADAYAAAAARGDADSIYAMLDERAHRSMSLDEVRRRVDEARGELAEQAKAIRSPKAETKTRAKVRFADGEQVIFDVRGDRFLIVSADALPALATSPAQALEELRRVLARRSYAGLVRVLSQSTRSAIENDLRSLVQGLENPEGLDVQQSGDGATVQVPGGHVIRLRREAGSWRIDDID